MSTVLKFNTQYIPNTKFILEKYLKDNNIPVKDFLIYTTPRSEFDNRIRFVHDEDALAAKLALSFLS